MDFVFHEGVIFLGLIDVTLIFNQSSRSGLIFKYNYHRAGFIYRIARARLYTTCNAPSNITLISATNWKCACCKHGTLKSTPNGLKSVRANSAFT
jgi:hypothetical protein